MSKDLHQAFASLKSTRVALEPGERLFSRGDPVAFAYYLMEGRMNLVRYGAHGTEVILHRATGPTFVAEASLYSDCYHCDALCAEAAVLWRIARRQFERLLANDPAISTAWAKHLAHSLQAARARSELLCAKTVAERLAGWLELNGGELPQKGRWHELAAELGVTPEALYRTLAKSQARPRGVSSSR